MSFPPTLTTRTVKGRFVTHPDGVPAKGFVRIVLDNYMQGPTDDAIVAPFDRAFPLVDGSFSAVLPATDDPQWTPSYYRVYITTVSKLATDRARGPREDTNTVKTRLDVGYNSSADIDLADVLNLPAPTPGETYIVAAAKGVPGGVATLGNDGYVVSTQLPPSSGGPVTWDAIEDKPASFPVAWDDITNKPATFPGSVAWVDVTGKPTTFTPSAHTHATSEVTGLDTALAGKASESELTSGLAGKANTVHNHATSDVTGLDTALASKASTTALTSGLAGKADTVHTHTTSQVTGLDTALAGKADATSTATAIAAKADASAVSTALGNKADLIGGVIPTAQMPSIAVIDFLGSVASQSAMLALVGQKGDWCIRTDLGQHWVITGADPTQLASWTAIPLPTIPVQTVNGQTGAVVLGKSDVGLSSVDNTSDVSKPVSTAQQTALNLKAPLASPTFTGTVSGVTAAMVGLGSVDNTADSAKPVSTAQQTALNLKAPLASPALTGSPTAPTPTAGDSSTAVATTAFVTAADNLKAPLASPTFTGTPAAPTATAGASTTQIATTAFVTTADNLKAPVASPTFTGTPAAPTAAVGTNTTQLATTAFVLANRNVLVLGPSDAVPGGTPAGTVIVRTAT